MKTTLTDHSRWPRGMCRERTSTVKLAGGFTFLLERHEQVGKLARLCRSMYGVNLGRHMVRCVEREFHESRNRVPSFLLQLGWRSQRIVSW